MAMIVYGTRVFVKKMGYVGGHVECSVCTKYYKMLMIRYRKWAHLEYLPLFPVKTTYFKMCPVCGYGYELKKDVAKGEISSINPQETQNFDYYAKHIVANKPKGIMSVDQSYEFWAKDMVSGEEICVAASITKEDVKKMKKERGAKKVPIIDVK